MTDPRNSSPDSRNGACDEPWGATWFKALRSHDAEELIRANPNAFILLYFIAKRAQRTFGYNQHNLAPGEALVGDYEQMGMTRQNYRTAMRHLETRGFATFKPTTL